MNIVNTNSKSHSFVLDVDGVLTTGQFFYSEHGKSYKVFGPHDNDGLKILKNRVEIQFITADSKGFEISRKRIVDDMGFSLTLVSENDRYEFVKKKYGLSKLFYMGDGIHDARLIKDCLFGVAPKNARIEAKKAANFVTNSNSAEGAVLDACLEINKIFFNG